MHKFNFWFVKQYDLPNMSEAGDIPVGIYYVIPNHFTQTLKLSTVIEKLLNGNHNCSDTISSEDTEILSLAKIDSKDLDNSFDMIPYINRIGKLRNSVVIFGQGIITNIPHCNKVCEAIALENVLVKFLEKQTLSQVRAYIIEIHQQRMICTWYCEYLKEMIKTLLSSDAEQQLKQVRKALYRQQ